MTTPTLKKRFTERFLPNPFNDKKEQRATGAKVETIQVTNSVLVCEYCFKEADTGEYTPGNNRLTFTCPDGHENVVRGIELE